MCVSFLAIVYVTKLLQESIDLLDIILICFILLLEILRWAIKVKNEIVLKSLDTLQFLLLYISLSYNDQELNLVGISEAA
jgi:hypothetical protein